LKQFFKLNCKEPVVLEPGPTLPFSGALITKGFASKTPLENEVPPLLEESSLDVDFYPVFLNLFLLFFHIQSKFSHVIERPVRLQPNHIRNFFI
jgi:hypothetical protein